MRFPSHATSPEYAVITIHCSSIPNIAHACRIWVIKQIVSSESAALTSVPASASNLALATESRFDMSARNI
jgi:hypothetical protein